MNTDLWRLRSRRLRFIPLWDEQDRIALDNPDVANAAYGVGIDALSLGIDLSDCDLGMDGVAGPDGC